MGVSPSKEQLENRTDPLNSANLDSFNCLSKEGGHGTKTHALAISTPIFRKLRPLTGLFESQFDPLDMLQNSANLACRSNLVSSNVSIKTLLMSLSMLLGLSWLSGINAARIYSYSSSSSVFLLLLLILLFQPVKKKLSECCHCCSVPYLLPAPGPGPMASSNSG